MSPTTWPVLRIELLRGAAPVAVAGVLVGGGVTLYSLAGDWASWPGRWMPFAASVRMSLFVIGAITVACAAWQGGRERRRRIGDQLASTARPQWQPVVVGWAGVTLGATAALMLLVAIGAALVVPVATYSGGGWWWVLAVSVPGLAALAALGFAAGRLVPSRLTAPVVGIGTYLLMVGAIDTSTLGGVRWLAPVLSQYDAPGYMLSGTLGALQALWFAGLAATALVVVAARRRRLAFVPAAVAVAAGFALVSEPVETWQPDPAAAEPVCADDAPNVCVSRLNAFTLDAVATAVQPVMERWDGVPEPRPLTDDNVMRNVGHAIRGYVEPTDDPVLEVQFDAGMTLTGRIAEPYDGMSLFSWWPTVGCVDDSAFERHPLVLEVTAAWGSGASWEWLEADRVAALQELESWSDNAQRDWFAAAIEAARTCDEPELERLAEEVR
jgi:hypothetical protein